MFNHKKSDIAVLGAGPVGLTAAHALTDRQMEYVLLDYAERTHTHSYALALHPETLELLDSIGVADRVLERARLLKTVAIYADGERKAALDYSCLPVKYPFLAVIRQGELENILVESLIAKGHKPQWHHRARYIEDEGDTLNIAVDRISEGMTGYAVAHMEMQIDKIFEYRTHYVIGADGYESTARRIAEIPFPEIAPPTNYAVFEFETDATLPDEMRLIIKDGKTHVFWPMPDGYCRWSFEVSDGEAPLDSLSKDHLLVQHAQHGFPLLDQAHLEAFLAKHAPWFKGSIRHLPWRMQVKFEKRLAESFGKHRIWLAGDSAHLAPPAGMLSMNVGMHEAVDLVERLAVGTDDNARQAALATYSADRLAEWNKLMDLDHHLSDSKETDQWIHRHKDALVANIPATGESLKALLAQIQLTAAA